MPHPDEGTIHAWLDGALAPVEARGLEEHLAGCADCTAAVAEARGLLAASSRILSALDSVPGGVLPATGWADAAGAVPLLRRASRWHSPAWRAAAAIVLVGSVSWLATHTGHRNDNAAEKVVAVLDTSARSAPTQEEVRRTVPQPATESSRPAATAARAGPRAARTAEPPPPSSSRVAAAAPMTRDATVRRMAAPAATPLARAGMVTGAVAGGAITTPDTATLATGSASAQAPQTAPLGRANDNAGSATSAAEQLVRDRSQAVRRSLAMQSAAPSVAKASAAILGPTLGSAEVSDRWIGCYAVEEPSPALRASRSDLAGSLLPARVELLAEPARGRDGERALRPAAGEPPFASGTEASWEVRGRDGVQLRISDGRRVTEVMLVVAGDNLVGQARVEITDSRERSSGVREAPRIIALRARPCPAKP